MDKLPADDPRILEALEACRPGSDDLSDPAMEALAARMAGSPELDGLYERLQRLDKVLADAYRDVPVPAGLADRILARLRESPADPAWGASLEEPPAIEAPQPAPGPGERPGERGLRRSRRAWMVGAGGLVAIAASLLIAVLLGIRSRQQPNLGQLYLAATDDFSQGLHEGAPRLAANDRLVAKYPWGAFVRQDVQIQWRQERELLGYPGVCYHMIGPGGVPATLYVLADDDEISLVGASATDPVNSGGLSYSAWREKGLLYVLVVAGEKHDYLRLFSPTSATVT